MKLIFFLTEVIGRELFNIKVLSADANSISHLRNVFKCLSIQKIYDCVFDKKNTTKTKQDDSFKEAQAFGFSPFKSRIRFIEHILKLGYDLDFGMLYETNKTEIEECKKLQIQEKYLQSGLVIDQPKQGDGNSNDGNPARRIFSDPKTAAIPQVQIMN